MPIYEYESKELNKACPHCSRRFEVVQQMQEPPLRACPRCGQPVRKVISWCRAAIVETSGEHAQVNQKIAEYEREGMWSHAAELADTHSEKTRNTEMKMRAIDNYEKAGYSADTLEKHSKSNNN
ncbi:MAG: zinc ribbon domain-containing protein [Deltaproteobacteria bacterium]|nr:zinc ribbon domain-containing protein [Deltaproteobacteria bacterium]